MGRLRQGFLSTLLILASLALSLALVEGYLWYRAGYQPIAPGSGSALFKFEDLYVSNRPLAVFDRVSGYRRTPGPTRIVRIMRDELVFDQTFTPNNKGYITATEFAEKKADSDVFRIVVFGDSFTASEFLPTPWPDRVNDALAGKTKRPVELYSFAVNGAGLWNWNSIFFNDVVPHYQFDAVLIAVWGDDLARPYSVLHYDETGQSFMSRFDTQPATDEEFFRDYFPKVPKHFAKVAPDAEIDAMIASIQAPWQPATFELRTPRLVAEFRSRIARRNAGIERLAEAAKVTAATDVVALEEIKATYGARQFGKLEEIMEYCRLNRIPVVLAALPSAGGAVAVAQSAGRDETAFQREVRSLAHHFGALYMNGHAPFGQVPPQDIATTYWLKYDGHWNQAGSDLFAGAMTRFLIENESVLSQP